MAEIKCQATITYQADFVLSEYEIVALNKVLQWSVESLVDGMLTVVGTTEAKQARPHLIAMLNSMRDPLRQIVSDGQDARAVFSGLATAQRKGRPDA